MNAVPVICHAMSLVNDLLIYQLLNYNTGTKNC